MPLTVFLKTQASENLLRSDAVVAALFTPSAACTRPSEFRGNASGCCYGIAGDQPMRHCHQRHWPTQAVVYFASALTAAVGHVGLCIAGFRY
jgi:hypothetical protein